MGVDQLSAARVSTRKKGHEPKFITLFFRSAGSETRTRMPVKAHAPETCVSTNSTTSALCGRINRLLQKLTSWQGKE